MPNSRAEVAAHPVVEQLDALTSLRFFAAIYVVLFHYASVHGSVFDSRFAHIGYAGVFLLSLIASVPFLLSLLLTMPPGPLKTLAASSALLAPLGLHAWLPGASCAINCPSWSISVEFFFYVLFPFFLLPIFTNLTGDASGARAMAAIRFAFPIAMTLTLVAGIMQLRALLSSKSEPRLEV